MGPSIGPFHVLKKVSLARRRDVHRLDGTRTLTITTADADIPEATALVFTIADVKTPSGALPA